MYTNGGGGNWYGQRISGLNDNGFTFYGGGGGGNHKKIINMPTYVIQPKHNSFLGWVLKILGIGDNRGWYQRVVFNSCTGNGCMSNWNHSGGLSASYYVAEGGLIPYDYYENLLGYVHNSANRNNYNYGTKERLLKSLEDRMNYYPTIRGNIKAHYIGNYSVITAGILYWDLELNAAFNVFNNGEHIKTLIGTGDQYAVNYLKLDKKVQGNSLLTMILNTTNGYQSNNNFCFHYQIRIRIQY
ncbi:MAG: hypothetical protein JW973_13095 [Bacteroidales bacterium]|nr:hypothetical protein [Bacteroidales bacterium]